MYKKMHRKCKNEIKINKTEMKQLKEMEVLGLQDCSRGRTFYSSVDCFFPKIWFLALNKRENAVCVRQLTSYGDFKNEFKS